VIIFTSFCTFLVKKQGRSPALLGSIPDFYCATNMVGWKHIFKNEKALRWF